MASNTELNAGSGGDIVTTKQRTHDGDTTKQQGVWLSGVSGSEDAYTFVDVGAGNGTAATALRVTLASDSTGTVNLGATDNAVLDSIATATAATQAAVEGTLTVGSHAVTNAGTFAVQESRAHTADFDTGAGTDTTAAFGIAVPASGGAAVVPGDATAGLKVDLGADNDVTVTGTVTVDNGGTFAVQAAQSGSWSATVTGAAAENAAVSGNPVLAGGRYDSSARTLGDGDVGAVALNASGQLLVEIAAGAGSGGTSAADDADFTAATTSGTPVMGAYQSSPTAVTDGDLGIVGITANREMKVSVTSITGSQTDDAAFTPGTGTVSMVGALFDDTATDTVDEGDGGALRMTNRRALYTTFETPNGDSPWDDTNDALQVNVVAGSTAGTEYTEDAAAPANPAGPTSMMERDDALGGLTPIEGDWSHQFCNANGALWTAIDGTVAATQSGTWNVTNISGTVSLPTGASTAANQSTANGLLTDIETNTNFGAVTGGGVEASALRVTLASDSTGVVSVDDNGGSLTVDGTVAATQSGTWNVTNISGTVSLPTGAATAANQSTMITALQLIDNPVLAHDSAVGSTQTMMAGARATNNIEGLTQVAANDGTRVTADLNGCLVTRPHSTLEEHISERVSNTDGASTAFTNFAAGGAGIHNYVMNVTITNTSSTDGYVDLRDGTAGAVLWTFPAPANSGATHAFSYPLKGSANTALAYDVSAALTTVYISVNGFQAQG